jgi:hypothetical protein
MSMSRPGSPSQSLPVRVLAAAAAALWLATTACSTATASNPATTTTTAAPSSSTSVTTVRIGGYVTINGKKVAIPDEGTKPIQPSEGVGEQIIITPTAIEPHLLFCQVKYRMTFTNLTSVPQQLRFVNDGGWRSPEISPGGAWHYTPIDGISYLYRTNTGLEARFQASAPIPGNP